MKCESLSTTRGPVADKPFPYSDHEALTAELALLRLEDSRQHGSSDSEYSDACVVVLLSEQQKQAFHISIANETLLRCSFYANHQHTLMTALKMIVHPKMKTTQ